MYKTSLHLSVFIPFLLLAVLSESLELSAVDDFSYQLQNYQSGLGQLGSSEFDLVVIDYSETGDETGEWLPAEIESLRSGGPCGSRIVLAYFSVGEAEDYRFYWNDSWVDASGDPIPGVAPTWLGPQNPEWPGNYKIRYWEAGWQQIIYGTTSGPDKSYLDRILSQGFDGVYLDIIDGFEYWGPAEIGGTDERRTAPAEMIDLVESIAQYARVTMAVPNFLVFPQNGSYIIDPDCYPDASDPDIEAQAQKTRLFSHIDGIGAEDSFYIGPADENNPYNPDNDTIALLNQFRDAGKKVLSIEYLTTANLIQDYYNIRAPAQGYIPYATVRDLGQMTVNTGYEPDCEPVPPVPALGQISFAFLVIIVPLYLQRVKNNVKRRDP
ncbi:MJ1477/TM1410 family putative glycoside hydrolase [candidate division CSSED10-310 bacterium]|uniref:MJ1477/TM1410 family putative glycoside hydrolase n=1 Tax=candidate division CSSED10-310 bacterium TaxID=2855610 RepID=A0ABV6YV14_UNCC1